MDLCRGSAWVLGRGRMGRVRLLGLVILQPVRGMSA